MSDGPHDQPGPVVPGEPDPAVPSPDRDAWKTVYFGQLSQDLVPYHPDPPEAPEDELTQMALADPDSVIRSEASPDGSPSFWRLLTVVAVAVGSLAFVFWRRR